MNRLPWSLQQWLSAHETNILETPESRRSADEVLTWCRNAEAEIERLVRERDAARDERDEALRGVMEANRKRLEAKELYDEWLHDALRIADQLIDGVDPKNVRHVLDEIRQRWEESGG